VHRQPRASFRVAHDRGAELGVARESNVVGCSAEQRPDRQPLLPSDPEVMMAGEHVLMASVALGVGGRAAHHFHPSVRHMSAMLLADAPAEHCSDIRSMTS